MLKISLKLDITCSVFSLVVRGTRQTAFTYSLTKSVTRLDLFMRLGDAKYHVLLWLSCERVIDRSGWQVRSSRSSPTEGVLFAIGIVGTFALFWAWYISVLLRRAQDLICYSRHECLRNTGCAHYHILSRLSGGGYQTLYIPQACVPFKFRLFLQCARTVPHIGACYLAIFYRFEPDHTYPSYMHTFWI